MSLLPMTKPSIRHAPVLALTTATGIVLVAAFVPRFADTYWAFELSGHFRAQLAVAAVALTLGFVVLHAWRHVLVAAGVSLFVATPVVMLWVPVAPRAAGGETIRVLSLNVSHFDRNHREVIALIESLRPDLVGLVEVTDRWVQKLSVLDQDYPYRASATTRRSGVALLSRFHLKDTELRPLASRRPNFALATMTVAGRPVRMAVVHAAAPMGAARAARRDQQLALLASVARESPEDEMILVGDFNTSPWSLTFRRLLDEAGWRNAAQGFGYLPTWPSMRLWLGIPIDHHLVSDGIAVHDFSVVGPTGSDHLAVLTELGIP